MDKVFEQMNSDYHSSMVIQIDAAEGGVLTGLDENDPRLQYFLAANDFAGELWGTTYSYVAEQIKDPGQPLNL